MSSDGKVHAAGSNNLGLVSDVELYRKAKACIKSHATEESDGVATTHALAYSHLPCSPSSAGWKQLGIHTVRAVRGILTVICWSVLDMGGKRGDEAWCWPFPQLAGQQRLTGLLSKVLQGQG